MGLLRSTIAVLLATAVATSPVAAETPLPVKKPRDRTGAPIVDGAAPPSVPSAAAPPGVTPGSGQTTSAAPPKGVSGGATANTGGAPESAGKSDAANPPAAKAEAPGKAKEWPAQDIELAKARCASLLKEAEAVTTAEAPFRDGPCGAPAPVRLISIGKSPEVTLSPPALVTCDMVAALAKWMKSDVQPMAKKHLGSSVVRIETMSDYSCRAAYGRVGNKLSEHAYANALDIRGFVTADAKTAYVLEGWGGTAREAKARMLAEKVAKEKALAEKAAAEAKAAADKARAMGPAEAATAPAEAKGSSPNATATASEAPGARLGKPTLIEGLPAGAAPDKGLGFKPAHLGGPKDSQDATSPKEAKDGKGIPEPKSGRPKPDAAAAKADDGKPKVTLSAAELASAEAEATPKTPLARFLRAAHDGACRIFGTTLGPETNEAHRNHLHVDMALRTHKNICE